MNMIPRTLDIDALEAGPELDALVAERVMGAKWIPYTWYDGSTKQYLLEEGSEPPRGDDFNQLPDGRLVEWWLSQYSTEIDAAFQAAEHYGLFASGHAWLGMEAAYGDRPAQWVVGEDEYDAPAPFVRANIPSLVICKAILYQENIRLYIAESNRKNEEAKSKLSFFREQQP